MERLPIMRGESPARWQEQAVRNLRQSPAASLSVVVELFRCVGGNDFGLATANTCRQAAATVLYYSPAPVACGTGWAAGCRFATGVKELYLKARYAKALSRSLKLNRS